MSQPTPLDSLIEHARAQRDEALQRLARSLAASRAAEDKLGLLESYRAEYRERLAGATANGITVAQLRAYDLFLDKLDAAIEQQRAIARKQAESAAAGRTAWAGSESRLHGYRALRERRAASAAAAERQSAPLVRYA